MKTFLPSLLCFLSSFGIIQAIPCDGTIVCNANVNYSVVSGCPALITYEIILNEICPIETYTVTVYDESGSTEIPNPVPASYFGESLIVTVEDLSGNLCFSEVIITDENSLFPVAPCSADIATVASANLSAGPLCTAEVTPSLILAEIKAGEIYTIELFENPDLSGIIPNPVPYEYFDQNLYAKVSNSSGNFSTSIVVVEDKTPPYLIFFTNPGTLSCQDDIAALDLAGALDECDNDVEVNLIDIEYLCGAPGPDSALLTYEAVDDGGNMKTSTFSVRFVDFCAFTEFPADITVNCPQDIPTDPTIIVSDVFECPREITINFSDISILGDCSVSRIFTLHDAISDITVIHTQLITVADETPPNFTANPDSEITFLEFMEDTYDPYLEVYDNCGIAATNIYVEYLEPADCARPEFMVRYYMYAIDNCGNEITETKDVLVIREGTARVRLDGRKDCGADFLVTANVTNMVPPLTYSWSSTEPSWTITPNPDNTATITPGSGMTDISVTVVDALGCSIEDSKKYVCNARGIRGRSVENDITVSPNPFKNSIFVDQVNGPVKAMVYNLEGKLIHNNEILASDGLELHLENIPAGLYFLKLHQGDQIFSYKIVKQE